MIRIEPEVVPPEKLRQRVRASILLPTRLPRSLEETLQRVTLHDEWSVWVEWVGQQAAMSLTVSPVINPADKPRFYAQGSLREAAQPSVRGSTGFYYEDDEASYLIWSEGKQNYHLQVTPALPLPDLLQVAESMAPGGPADGT
jgi:hypothetical protein